MQSIRSHRRSALVLAAAATLGIVSTSASAATLTWIGTGGDQFFQTPGNWSPSQGPTSSDDTVFPAVASAPTQTPLWNAAVSVQSVSIDNSGGFVWQLPRDGSGVRTVTLGGGGLSVVGGGTTTWGAITTTASVDQNWNAGSGTTLSFLTGATIAGGGKISKTGDGTIVLPNATNSNTAGYDVLAGTLANTRSTAGAGTGTVTVFNGGTYEARGANIASSPILINNGGRLLGTGTAGIASGNPINIDNTASAVMNIGTATGTDVFSLTPAVTGGDATSVVQIFGPGTVTLSNGSDGATSFAGTWRVNSGTLRALAINSLGNRNGTPSFTNVQNPSTVQLNGGTIAFAGTTSGSTAVNFNSPVQVTADSALVLDKGGVAGTAANSGATISRVLGPVTIGNNTLDVSASSNITGGSAAGYVRIGGGAVNLTGDATFNVVKPSFDLTFVTNGISDGGGGHGFTKTGNGALNVNGPGTYSGATNILGGIVFVNNVAGLGSTSSVNVAAGATLNIGTTGYTSRADLTGSGLITIANTLNLLGSEVSPGSSAGILSVTGNLSLGLNASEKSTLVIEVLGGGAVAGVDFDQLAVSGNLTGLANTDLVIDVGAVDPATLVGDVLPIVLSASNFTGLQFSSVAFSNGASADVNYNNGSITLSNIVVPEPASLSLLALGATALLRRRR